MTIKADARFREHEQSFDVKHILIFSIHQIAASFELDFMFLIFLYDGLKITKRDARLVQSFLPAFSTIRISFTHIRAINEEAHSQCWAHGFQPSNDVEREI